jgi:gamma-glutamyltranspeptidase
VFNLQYFFYLCTEKLQKDIVSNLTARGHTLEQTKSTLNCVQGVKKVKDEVEAYSDKRDGGRAAQF